MLVGICYISSCHVWVAVCQYSPVVVDYYGGVHSVFGGGPTV